MNLLRMRNLVMVQLLAAFTSGSAQPYLDIAQFNLYGGPGVVRRMEAAATLPIPLDSLQRRLLVLDPYHVRWRYRTPGAHYEPALDGAVQEEMAGNGLGVTLVTPVGRSRWTITVAGIARYHWLGSTDRGDWQGGGVALGSRRVSSSLTWRWGVYANHDAFGWFVRPLLGIHWRIAPGKQLFGVLPGALTYEQRLGRAVRGGFSFRAYTSSFGTREGDYRRIDENPLGAYLDLYVLKHLVVRGEVGYSLLRQYRGGPKDPCTNAVDPYGYVDHALGDGAYGRIVVAYRLRLDGEP